LDENTLEIPPDMMHYELPTVDFWGKFIHSVDTDNGDRERWAELQLWEIIDTSSDALNERYGKRMFLLYTIGHSLVVHRASGGCNRGVKLRAGGFATRTVEPLSELLPCEECDPSPDWALFPEREYRLEVTWYTDVPCETADKLVASLYREPRCDGCRHKPHEDVKCYRCGCTDYAEAPKRLSVPGTRLIEEIRDLYPDVAKAATERKKY